MLLRVCLVEVYSIIVLLLTISKMYIVTLSTFICIIFITVPDNYLVFTQIHNSVISFEVDRTDIRMMSLDTIGQYIDVLVPINLRGTESVFIAYDQVDHRVHFTI